MNFHNRQIRRIILQVRYEPTGDFVDNRGKILNLLKGKWNHLAFKHDKIIMKDEEKNLEGLITWKLSQITIENIPNFGIFKDLSKSRFPNDLWEIMNVKKFSWMGCRTMMVYSQEEKFDDIVDKLLLFYSVPNDCWDIIGGKPADVGFPFTFLTHERRINLTFGPMEKDQMKNQFFKVHENLPEIGLFIDCDYICNKEFESNKIRTFLNEAIEFADNKACDFVQKVIKSRSENK